jgi:methyl-accepting chemotaxis protein
MFSRLLTPGRVLGPLEAMTSSRWDLTAQLPQPRMGPFRLMAGLVNKLLIRLKSTIGSIASTSVNLSSMAPELGRTAQTLAESGKEQELSANQIAQAGRELEELVEEVTGSTEKARRYSQEVALLTQKLHEGSSGIGSVMKLIAGVATQTRLLSLNAAVEAARAGEHGLGFAVVAGEVQRLADETMQATGKVGEILEGVTQCVEGLVKAVGDGASSTGLEGIMERIADQSGRQREMVRQVADGIGAVAAGSTQQAASAADLSRLAGDLRQTTDALLLAVGVFRLDAHRRAGDIVRSCLQSPQVQAMKRAGLEQFMLDLVRRYDFFELAYVTDARGRQITANIARPGTPGAGEHAMGRDWSARPWFTGAMQGAEVYTSDIYRSVATDSFCFTISGRIQDQAGRPLGVFAADVHFGGLVGQENGDGPKQALLPGGSSF